MDDQSTDKNQQSNVLPIDVGVWIPLSQNSVVFRFGFYPFTERVCVYFQRSALVDARIDLFYAPGRDRRMMPVCSCTVLPSEVVPPQNILISI